MDKRETLIPGAPWSPDRDTERQRESNVTVADELRFTHRHQERMRERQRKYVITGENE